MGFFGQDAEGVISGRKKDPVTGKVKATFMDSLFGRSQSELDSAQTQMETTQSRAAGKRFAEDSGYSATELGLDFDKTSKGAVQSKIRLLEEGKVRERDATNHSRSMEPLTAQLASTEANNQRNFLLSQKQGNDQMELSRMQMAQSDKNRLADRADARDARADDLMFRRETMERADRKEERNRRRDSIAALTSGLAALGAAFAI
jgi:hypothetical protein